MNNWEDLASGQFELPLPGQVSVFSNQKENTLDRMSKRLKETGANSLSMDNAKGLLEKLGVHNLLEKSPDVKTLFIPEDRAMKRIPPKMAEVMQDANGPQGKSFAGSHIISEALDMSTLVGKDEKYPTMHPKVDIRIIGPRNLPKDITPDKMYVQFLDPEGNELSTAQIIGHGPAEDDSEHIVYIINNTPFATDK